MTEENREYAPTYMKPVPRGYSHNLLSKIKEGTNV